MSEKRSKRKSKTMAASCGWAENGVDDVGVLSHAEQVNGVLFGIANAVNTTLNLYDLYQSIHQSLGSILDVTNFFIALVDSENRTLHFPYFVDEVDDDFSAITDFRPEDSLTGLVVIEQKPLLLRGDDLKEREGKNGIWGPSPLVWMGVPLFIRKRVIGVIAVQSYTDGDIYQFEDLELLSAISHQVALAIDRKQSLQKLISSEDRFRQLFEHSNDAILVHIPNGKIVDCNKRATEMLGYSRAEFFELMFPESFYPPDRKDGEQLYGDLEKYGHLRFESRLIKSDSTCIDVELSAKNLDQLEQPVAEVIIRDITAVKIAREEKHALEEKLNRSEKMEALGLMASGVAHDLNNILSGIVSYPELILLKLDKDHELVPPVKAIFEAGKRAADVVADLLTIARSAANVREIHRIDILIFDYLYSPECQVLKTRFPDVVFRTNFSNRDLRISCSPVHVKKSLMNLITNGAEAIKGKGEIVIETDCKPCLGSGLESDENNGAVECVTLSVRDTGSGIGDDEIEHIFEPFYSRKTMDRSGSGLGLAVVSNTMESHDGKVHVETSSKGTCFTLSFPVATAKGGDVKDGVETVRYQGNGERILIVDDEPQIRDIASQILSALGYSTYAVASGEEALEFLEKKSVDLVVLDMMMEPGLNGRQVYEKMIKIRPSQKAVIATGYAESEDVDACLKLGVSGLVKKPYSFAQLSKVVRNGLLKK